MSDSNLKSFTVEVMMVPPVFMIELGQASANPETWRKRVTIKGRDLEDAMRRAGIS